MTEHGDQPRVPGRVRVIGPGRMGSALAQVLTDLGWDVAGPIGRDGDVAGAAHGVDLVVISTPDAAVAEVAAAVEPDEDALVVHVAGASGLDVLAAHPRRGGLHPLVSVPDVSRGAARLVDGAWFAIAANTGGDLDALRALVVAMGGHPVEVADEQRAAYHAAAVVASNHLVALMGQVQRIAAPTGIPWEAFSALATRTLEGLSTSTPAEALTGPVRRGDWATVTRHLDAIEPAERSGYAAMAELALRLVQHADPPPEWLAATRRGDSTDEEDRS